MIGGDLLPHSCLVKSVVSQDADRNPVFGEPTTLSQVRCRRAYAKADGATGAEPTETLKVYFDAEKSAPSGFEAEVGQKVEFDGREWTVEKVRPLCAKSAAAAVVVMECV